MRRLGERRRGKDRRDSAVRFAGDRSTIVRPRPLPAGSSSVARQVGTIIRRPLPPAVPAGRRPLPDALS